MVEELTLRPDELVELTGYVKAGAQLAELRRQGFHRARRNALGKVVLERAHYAAVCAGVDAGISISAWRTELIRPAKRPKLASEK
jgi:Domain of unknown function (DUF4224)